MGGKEMKGRKEGETIRLSKTRRSGSKHNPI